MNRESGPDRVASVIVCCEGVFWRTETGDTHGSGPHWQLPDGTDDPELLETILMLTNEESLPCPLLLIY